MHDIDRTHSEFEGGYELEYGQGQDHEQFVGGLLKGVLGGELESEHEQFLGGILKGIIGGELEAPLHPSTELELASELLEVSGEQEFEQFLGNVFSTAADTVGKFIRSDTGQALGGILKDAAKQALPVVGRAIGEHIAPGRGGAMGGRIAEAAGSLLGLELEGLSPQDQEFESARQFVRFASSAAQQAALAPPSIAPETAAQAAATAAAHTFAPGIAHEIRVGFRGFRPGYRRFGYRPGYRYHGYARPGVYRADAWRAGWRPGPVGIPIDWARYRAFLGDAPPPPPHGAPGNWVFGGFRHGRRRWSWIPVPGAAPFVVAPPVEAPPPDAIGGPLLPIPDFGAQPPAIGPDAGQPPGAFGAPAGPGQPLDPPAGAAPGGAAPGAPGANGGQPAPGAAPPQQGEWY